MIDKIRLWWRFEARYFHKNFIKGVKNLWKWFPTIWKDRDWDSYYIYEILRVKIENQAKYIGDRNFHTEAKRDAERMLLVTKLIKLQQDDTYGMEYMDYHESEYSFEPVEGKEGVCTLESTVISERYQEFLDKYPSTVRKIKKEEKDLDLEDKRSLCFYVSSRNQEKANSLLFRILEERIGYWWD